MNTQILGKYILPHLDRTFPVAPTLETPLMRLHQIVSYLHDHGRKTLAGKLVRLVEDLPEDPETANIIINRTSLREMAMLLVEQGHFADPSIAVSQDGLMHAQWRIDGNGVIVWGFMGNGEILAVVQADTTPNHPPLNIAEQRLQGEILKEFGYLVPHR